MSLLNARDVVNVVKISQLTPYILSNKFCRASPRHNVQSVAQAQSLSVPTDQRSTSFVKYVNEALRDEFTKASHEHLTVCWHIWRYNTHVRTIPSKL